MTLLLTFYIFIFLYLLLQERKFIFKNETIQCRFRFLINNILFFY